MLARPILIANHTHLFIDFHGDPNLERLVNFSRYLYFYSISDMISLECTLDKVYVWVGGEFSEITVVP